jgi:hypothetical protein
MDPIKSEPQSEPQSEPHRRVLTLLARGQADQDTLAERLNPEERAAQGELYDWSPKDHVAHNNFWRQDAIWRLQAALEGGSPPDTDDDLAWNDRVFPEQRETPWEELVAETERLRAELLLSQPALRRCQFFLVRLKEAGIAHLLAAVEHHHVIQAQIDADLAVNLWQGRDLFLEQHTE